MTKHNHPYPAHIVEAVAKGLYAYQEEPEFWGHQDWDNTSSGDREAYTDLAHAALQALWDASRVDTLEQMEALPDHTFIVDEGGFCIEETPSQVSAIFIPAHVIYWGDSND